MRKTSLTFPTSLCVSQQLLAIGVVRGNAGRKLPAVLDIQQHPGHQPRDFVGAMRTAQRIGWPAGKMINGRYSALVMQVRSFVVSGC